MLLEQVSFSKTILCTKTNFRTYLKIIFLNSLFFQLFLLFISRVTEYYSGPSGLVLLSLFSFVISVKNASKITSILYSSSKNDHIRIKPKIFNFIFFSQFLNESDLKKNFYYPGFISKNFKNPRKN